MTEVEAIESATANLSPEELASFREWFAGFDAARWDREIEDDVLAGRLGALAADALDDLRQGRFTELPSGPQEVA